MSLKIISFSLPFFDKREFDIGEYRYPDHVYDDGNKFRMPFYRRLDISAAREFSWMGLRCSLFVHTYNLFVHGDGAFHMALSNEIIYGLPIIPTAGLHFNFR